MLNRHESCIGICLFKSSRHFVQIWFCPKGYEIKSHSHDDEDIELMYLLGSTTFYRILDNKQEAYTPKWFNMFRSFSVKAGVVHWFKVSTTLPLVFINFATFKTGCKPVSAAIDFNKS